MKNEIIEKKIDSYEDNGEMGQDMVALIGLQARVSFLKNKPTKFIVEFSESLGFKKHLDTAMHILEYLYPRNTYYWSVQDKRYSQRVEKSPWLQYNLQK
jgi:hypothetical protein